MLLSVVQLAAAQSWNAQLPIFKLPFELLRLIFSWSQPPPSGDVASLFHNLTLTSTCHRWRDWTYQMREFWPTVVIGDKTSVECMNKMLSVTTTTLFTMNINFRNADASHVHEIARSLPLEIPFCTTLNISIVHQEHTSIFPLRNTFGDLKIFKLKSDIYRGDRYYPFLPPLHPTPPGLKNLHLTSRGGYPFLLASSEIFALPTLTTVFIGPDTVSPGYLWALLDAVPGLEKLDWLEETWLEPPDPDVVRNRTQPQVPRVQDPTFPSLPHHYANPSPHPSSSRRASMVETSPLHYRAFLRLSTL